MANGCLPSEAIARTQRAGLAGAASGQIRIMPDKRTPDRRIPARRSDDDDEIAVRSIPLDTEDGGQVVIEQQNVGPANQVGGGEFKRGSYHKSPEQAAAEQARLERDAPIDVDDQGEDEI
jgi:hypothetical protein